MDNLEALLVALRGSEEDSADDDAARPVDSSDREEMYRTRFEGMWNRYLSGYESDIAQIDELADIGDTYAAFTRELITGKSVFSRLIFPNKKPLIP